MPSLLHKYFTEMGIDVNWYKKSSYKNPIISNYGFDELRNVVSKCENCKLYKTRNKTVFGSGSINAEIMIIGEAPGRDEDEQGEPFIGRAGKLLDAFLKSINLSREKVYITNTVKCRPPDNRNPSAEELDQCSSFLTSQINAVKPKVLVLLGKVAAKSLLDDDSPMAELRQKRFFIDKYNIPIIVFYHPAYILRSPLKKSEVWEDLKYLNNLLNENVC
jgi:uracil-DNA glycosylase family 4